MFYKIKNKPSTEAVQNQMKLIQGIIDRNKLPANRIANEDETNIVPCPELLAQYVPPNANRAIDPGSDESSFTALLGATAERVNETAEVMLLSMLI